MDVQRRKSSHRSSTESNSDFLGQEQLEMQALIVSRENAKDRRESARWPVDWHLEGWIELDDVEGPAIPLVLIDFGPGGIGVVLHASHSLRTDQCGKLIIQSHGSGCSAKPVCCRSLRIHPLAEDLQCAGFSFE